MNNHLITRINLSIKKLNKYYKILIFPVMLFTISSCTEKVEIVSECDPCTSPTSYIGFRALFTEDFNGTSLNEAWSYENGNGCPGNCGFGTGELQLYQNSNVTLRDGNLVITAKKETVGTNLYTSGRITTFDTLSFTYGRIDVRAKLSKGQGLWPAIWLLGNNSKVVGWPNTGQISIEMRGGEIDGRNNTIFGKLFWGEKAKLNFLSNRVSLENGIFNDKFHVFSIIKEPSRIQWLLNDKVYFEQIIDPSMIETFNKPFHLILNVAVGGEFPGSPDVQTIFPQEMVVDYIRVFQK
jgi:beta-glucanase (GH16 family)